MDKLKTLIDGLARLEKKIDGMTQDHRVKVTEPVREKIIALSDLGLSVSIVRARIIKEHKMRLSAPTIRKIIRHHRRETS